MNEIKTHRQTVAATLTILFLAALLRFIGIDSQELWLDETFSFHMATISNLRPYLEGDLNPPIYYFILRAWITIVGDSEASLRSLSALFGVAFVALIIHVGRVIFCTRVSLWAGLIATVSPIHIYYSQEARSYSLLVFSITLYLALLWRASLSNRKQDWLLAAIGIAFAFHVHNFALLALPPICALVWTINYPNNDKIRNRLGATILLALLLSTPWIVWRFIMTGIGNVDTTWVNDLWHQTPPWLAIPRSLEVLILGGQKGLPIILLKQFSTLDYPQLLRICGLVTLSLVMILAAIPWRDKLISVRMSVKSKIALWALSLFPLVTLWLVSLIRPVYMVGRYDIVALPGFCLLLGFGFAKLYNKDRVSTFLRYGLAITLLFPIFFKLFLYYQAAPVQNIRETVNNLHISTRQDDVVVFTGTRGIAITYYLHQLGYRWKKNDCVHSDNQHRFACFFYPSSTMDNFVYDPEPLLSDEKNIRMEAMNLVSAITSREGSLWMIFGHASPDNGTIHISPIDYRLVQELTLLGLVYEPTNDPLILRFRLSDVAPTKSKLM